MAHLAHSNKLKAAKPGQSRKSRKKNATTAQPPRARNAKQQAKKIIASLREAEQIQKGKRKGKTFDEFLEEL